MEMNVDDARNSDRLSTDVLLATGTSRQQLRQASADELLSLQTQLLMGDRWGMWEVSPRLIASTTSRNASCVVRLDLVTPEGQ